MKKQSGFSLAELIILAVICAIIAMIAVPAILRERRAVVEAEIAGQGLVAACTPSHVEGDDAWYFPCNDENFPKALDVFEKKHPELRVVSIFMQPEDHGATVTTEPIAVR